MNRERGDGGTDREETAEPKKRTERILDDRSFHLGVWACGQTKKMMQRVFPFVKVEALVVGWFRDDAGE